LQPLADGFLRLLNTLYAVKAGHAQSANACIQQLKEVMPPDPGGLFVVGHD
jgi:hypothetical protein